MARIRVMLVDDHYLVRVGLANVLGFEADMEVCAQAESGDDALVLFREHRPDVTVMDLRMAGTDGLAALAALRRESPGARVIILSNYTGADEIHAALQAGAASYLPKTVGQPELLKAIRLVAEGRSYVPPEIAVRLAERLPCDELTAREQEVLTLVVQGASNARIARELGIAGSTVKNHISSIFEKLGVTQRTEAVAVAIKRGIARIE
ncbi:MAG: response regulator transcription factor [Vicinamibacteria bacterium]